MSAARGSTVIKVTLNETVDPDLFRAIGTLPVRARSRRLLSLARLGILVEQGRLQQVGLAADRTASDPGSTCRDEAPAALDPSLMGEGLDDLLANIGGPLPR